MNRDTSVAALSLIPNVSSLCDLSASLTALVRATAQEAAAVRYSNNKYCSFIHFETIIVKFFWKYIGKFHHVPSIKI